MATALSGIEAENLEKASGVTSRTIASLELGWAQGREQLDERDIVVLDEPMTPELTIPVPSGYTDESTGPLLQEVASQF
jgi:hypothetical protein